MTPHFVTPAAFQMSGNRRSTRQLLAKIPNVLCLYRHKINGTYYGVKMTGCKRKEHSCGILGADQFLEGSAEWGKSRCPRPLRRKVSRHIKASSPVWLQNGPVHFKRH